MTVNGLVVGPSTVIEISLMQLTLEEDALEYMIKSSAKRRQVIKEPCLEILSPCKLDILIL